MAGVDIYHIYHLIRCFYDLSWLLVIEICFDERYDQYVIRDFFDGGVWKPDKSVVAECNCLGLATKNNKRTPDLGQEGC